MNLDFIDINFYITVLFSTIFAFILIETSFYLIDKYKNNKKKIDFKK